MTLSHEFREALESGVDYDALVKMLERYHLQGMSFDDIYEDLHAVWLQYGFDAEPADNDIKNQLEAVMEAAWYRRTGKPAISS